MAMHDGGVQFSFAADTIASGTTTPVNIFSIKAGAANPLTFQTFVIEGNQTASLIYTIRLGIVTGETHTGTAVSAVANVGAGTLTTNASLLTLVSGTPGTISKLYDARQWNYFAEYKFDQSPGGFSVPAGATAAVQITNTISSAINVSFSGTYVEYGF